MHARRRPSAAGWLGPLCRRADLQALHRVGDRKQLRVQLARDLVLHLLHASPSVGYGDGHTDLQGCTRQAAAARGSVAAQQIDA
jgi:hypothetical protein